MELPEEYILAEKLPNKLYTLLFSFCTYLSLFILPILPGKSRKTIDFDGRIATIAIIGGLCMPGAGKIEHKATWGPRNRSCGVFFRGPIKNF